MAQINVGIDFGTTSTRVGILRNGSFEVILTDQGHREISSTVAFTDTECLIGQAAQNQAIINPKNTVSNIRRLIGRTFNDPVVQANVDHWPFSVKNVQNEPRVEIYYEKLAKLFHPEEIASMILAKAKETAEVYLGKKVTGAVITVPANFNNSQRQATLNAGTLAGFTELRLINEPTAAAIAYGLERRVTVKHNILVLHLEGDFFDVSILTIDQKNIIEVKSTIGHANLSGGEFSSRLTQDVANFFQIISDHIESALVGAEMEKSCIDDIVLVGSSTHMPRIHSLLQDIFNRKQLNTFIDSDEAVVYGAAVKAAILQGEQFDNNQKIICLDINPRSLGFEVFDGLMNVIIEKNRTLPTEETFDFNMSFSTLESTFFKIKVYEGEHTLVRNNELLGEFESSKIKPPSNYIGNIQIKFMVNENGILEISAFNLSSSECISLSDKKKMSNCQICDEITFDPEHLQKNHLM